jgi:SAM-dependent methyltransferase
VFSEIYDKRSLGSEESGSGTGTELRATETIQQQLPDLLRRLGAKILLDAPCGDWNWMQHITLPVERYYGVDIVPSVIEADRTRFGDSTHTFEVADLTSDPLPKADVILCRDCLVHLSFQDIATTLENFRGTGATWLLLNTYPEIEHNRNRFTGQHWRRLNFLLPPFGFPAPIETIPDGGDVDPSQLGLWRLQEMPHVQSAGSST